MIVYLELVINIIIEDLFNMTGYEKCVHNVINKILFNVKNRNIMF